MPNINDAYTPVSDAPCPKCGASVGHTLNCDGVIPKPTENRDPEPAFPPSSIGLGPVPVIRNDRTKIMEAMAELARRDLEPPEPTPAPNE